MFDFRSGDWLAIGIFAVVGLLGWGLTGAVVGLLVAAGLLLGARLVGIVIGVPIHLLFAWLEPDAYAAWRYNQVRKHPEDFSADEVAEVFGVPELAITNPALYQSIATARQIEMQAASAATYHSQPSFAVGTPSEPSQATTAAAVMSCTVCRDRGGCPSCHGATVFESKPCRTCRTTGLCPVCSRAQA